MFYAINFLSCEKLITLSYILIQIFSSLGNYSFYLKVLKKMRVRMVLISFTSFMDLAILNFLNAWYATRCRLYLFHKEFVLVGSFFDFFNHTVESIITEGGSSNRNWSQRD